MSNLKKIISGGSTGADRATLDAAMGMGTPVGSWCPKGRKAEDGPIDDKYPLQETASGDYKVRIGLNVRDSDGTLVLTKGKPTGGTAITVEKAQNFDRPCMVVDLDQDYDPEDVKFGWMIMVLRFLM